MTKNTGKKIGIYSGTFDPVHHGHIAFARRAAHQLGLDKVYFLVEPEPSHKQQAQSLRHRLNMTWLALQDYPKLELLPAQQQHFTVSQTLPWLEEKFEEAELHLLMGTDLFNKVHTWPGFDELKRRLTFVVGQRADHDSTDSSVEHQSVQAELSDLTSSAVRALQPNQLAGLVPEPVVQYINAQGLYSADSAASAASSSALSSSVSKSL